MHVFRNGQERDYLDLLTQTTSTCRLGTTKDYVYHLGNQIPKEKTTDTFSSTHPLRFPPLPKRKRGGRILQLFYRYGFALLKRYYKA
jgi:hypothetical protein